MSLLGHVHSVTAKGFIIIRARFAPSTGSQVADKAMNVLGTVTRIFGPVNSPFVSLRPNKKVQHQDLLGIEVYLIEKGGKYGKKNRRM